MYVALSDLEASPYQGTEQKITLQKHNAQHQHCIWESSQLSSMASLVCLGPVRHSSGRKREKELEPLGAKSSSKPEMALTYHAVGWFAGMCLHLLPVLLRLLHDIFMGHSWEQKGDRTELHSFGQEKRVRGCRASSFGLSNLWVADSSQQSPW